MTLLDLILSKLSNDWNNSIWKGSKFEKLYVQSSKRKGTIGEEMTKAILSDIGLVIGTRTNSDHDFSITYNKKVYKIENKLSLTWGNEISKFKWQQIRDQDYDFIFFIGVNPNDHKVWWATKQDLKTYIIGNDKYRQHGGKNGKQDIYWITSIESWFRPLDEFTTYLTFL